MKIRWALRTCPQIPFRLKTAALPSSALAPLVAVTAVTPPPAASTLATNLQSLSQKRIWGQVLMRVGLLLAVVMAPIASVDSVFATGAPSLVISQFKLTSSAGQFVTLYNQTNAALDLGQYEVDYINSSNKLTNVPISGQLPAHGFYLLSDDQVRICYQVTLSSVSLGFSTTSGTLQIWQVSADKTVKQLQDTVTWASKATTGAVTLPTQNAANTVSELRQPTDSLGNPQVTTPAGGTWQAVAPDATNPCNLDIINTTTKLPSGSSNPGNQLATGQAPPSTIVTITNDQDTAGLPTLPAADVGLAAPQITELLPNPDGTGTDETDEFIELYNPNAVPFHLVGFTLETGTTTKHKYAFPDGTVLQPQSFTAFYSSDTNLTLSNTAGQAD
ncbi:MAG TPA: lamin tail domain-containing protein, partial [Candidatus Saccharimonadales bacterium]|nr:lamin tail domain-containing protein [Candidatus Saccharimonadales bacterium]